MNLHAPGCKAFRYPDTAECTCGAAKREAPAASAPAGEPRPDVINRGDLVRAVKDIRAHTTLSEAVDCAARMLVSPFLSDRVVFQKRLHALEAENATLTTNLRRLHEDYGILTDQKEQVDLDVARVTARCTALEAERDAAIAKLQEPDVYLRKALEERDAARENTRIATATLTESVSIAVDQALKAEAQLSALRTALEALEKKWRVKQDPGVLSELGLRAQRERVRCADDLAAVLRTQE